MTEVADGPVVAGVDVAAASVAVRIVVAVHERPRISEHEVFKSSWISKVDASLFPCLDGRFIFFGLD